MSTQFGITVTRSGARALLHEPRAHRLADRDDAVGATQVPASRARAATATTAGLSIRPSRTAVSGKTSCDDDDERHAEAARDDQRDVADHRRVRHREDDVGPLARERRRAATERGTSRSSARAATAGAARTPSSARGRSSTPSRTSRPAGAFAQRPRDDRHVEVAREVAAQIARAAGRSPRRPAR